MHPSGLSIQDTYAKLGLDSADITGCQIYPQLLTIIPSLRLNVEFIDNLFCTL